MVKPRETMLDRLEKKCKTYGDEIFTSTEIYEELQKTPNNRGNKRKYSLSHAQVNQTMARAPYLEKVEDDGERNKRRTARYRNRRPQTISIDIINNEVAR